MEDGSPDNLVEPLRACQVDECGRPAARSSIAAARGRFLALLDSDDVWLPEKLARHVAAVMMITADSGRMQRSNGYRVRLWKGEARKLADEPKLPITVCHLPPGTSK